MIPNDLAEQQSEMRARVQGRKSRKTGKPRRRRENLLARRATRRPMHDLLKDLVLDPAVLPRYKCYLIFVWDQIKRGQPILTMKDFFDVPSPQDEKEETKETLDLVIPNNQSI